jgi:predicted RecB family endonuclease
MLKQLYVAFTGEGATDETFLSIIIRRTLEAISLREGGAFDIMDIIWLGSSKGANTLERTREAYQAGAQILFIHRDTDQHSYEVTFQRHIQPIMDELPLEIREKLSIVSLLIKHEQETWMLADLDTLDEILGNKLDRAVLNLPPDLESRANTKELLKEAIRMANVGQTRGRGFKLDAVVERLANEIDLEQLKRLPGYQRFVQETEEALREIGYLRR